MTPDVLTFLRALHSDGYRELRAFASEEGGGQDLAHLPVSDLDGVLRFAAKNERLNVYVGVAVRGPNGRKDYVALRALFAEIDFSATKDEAAVRAQLAQFPVPPSIVIHSGGGLHVYWLLREPLPLDTPETYAVAKRVLRSLAEHEHIGGDTAAAEPARILRLPGTWNHKPGYDTPRPVVMESCTDARYSVEQFSCLMPTDAVGVPTPSAPALPVEVEKGQRNKTLFVEACRLRRLGWDPVEIAGALKAINAARCRPPLSDSDVEGIATSAGRYAPQADTFALSDSGNAEFFGSLVEESVRYDHGRKLWFTFRDHRWQNDRTNEIERMALEAIRARQVAAHRITDSAKRLAHIKWATRSESHSARHALVQLAKSLESLSVTGDDWDIHPLLLGVQNGVIDLETGQLRDGAPGDGVTRAAPISFDPGATCPRFDLFLRQIFRDAPELVDYVQRVFGYSLTGLTTEQAFWILCGSGANGKSTLMEVFMRGVVGADYAWTMPFPTTGWTNAMSEYQKASLAFRRVIAASEVAHRGELNDEFIKTLTGGDTINARHPFGRPFVFVPLAKMFLRVNDKPIIRDQTHGMWRRVKLLPFNQTFAVDTTLADALMAEAPGILRWAVEGCLQWQRDGLRHPGIVDAATKDYRAESDQLAQFVDGCCEVAPNAETRAGELFGAYRDWCDRTQVSNLDRLNQTTFGKRLKERYAYVEKRGVVHYAGIGLRKQAREIPY